MISVELVYDEGDAELDNARRNLKLALMKAGLPPSWSEWERSSPMATWARSYASATILVNRNNVASTGVLADAGAVNQSGAGRLSRVPPVPMIAAALSDALAGEHARASAAATKQGWLRDTLLITLACLGCCLPLFAVGMAGASLAPLIGSGHVLAQGAGIVAIAVVLVALGFEGRRSGYAPLLLGTLAAGIVLLGTWFLAFTPITYAGFGLLAAAVGWSFLAHRRKASASCCPPVVSSQQQSVTSA